MAVRGPGGPPRGPGPTPDWVPDRVPDWLVRLVKQSKGRNLNDFSGLDEFYKETESVRADRFDRKFYQDIRDKASELEDLSNSRFTDDPSWVELIQDEFLSFYKTMPELRKPEEMKPTHRINHAAMSKATELTDWKELRTYTELDQWSAAMAAVAFGLRLGELFDEMKELQEAQEKLNKKNDGVQDLIDQLEQAAADDVEGLLDQLQQELAEFDDLANDVGNQIQQNQNQLRQAAKQATESAKDDAENLMGMLETFGTDPGALRRMSAEARIELARRIQRNRKLRELADKVGRFVRLALGEQARKIVHGSEELHDITLGDNINRAVLSEMTLLAHDATKVEFYRKVAEHELLQYELRGTEEVARGAIIALLDSSGSMGGAKEIWAKAVALALLNIASKQRRDFVGIVFSSAHDPLLEWHFPKGHADPSDVLDFAEAAYMGGTDFMLPIGRAVNILEEMYEDAKAQKGDIVLITDGECAVSEEWLDRYMNAKHELAFRTYSCQIGFNSKLLHVLSDQVYNITELAQGGDVKEMFGYI